MSVVEASRPARTATAEFPDVRADFPILDRVNARGQRLVYLDSAASSQKPLSVLDVLDDYYRHANANIHRGVYELSADATERYEAARTRSAQFINAANPRECVFVRNTTEGLNLVAHAWGRSNIHAGDLIVGAVMDHHSNIVPWQMLARETGATLAHIPVLADGVLNQSAWQALLERRPRLVTLPHVSNVLGVINPIREMIRDAHRVGAVVVIDAAQSAPHLPLDVQDLDCDFLAFSGHKMLAPMGSGVLYGKLNLLEEMPPFLGGGGMIDRVDLEESTWAAAPAKFEAGTPAVGEAIGLGVAMDYLDRLDRAAVLLHEQELTAYARRQLRDVPGLVMYGPDSVEKSCGVIAFHLRGYLASEVAEVLSGDNVAVRAGKHCCQPLLRALGAPSVLRASFYVYNTPHDVDRLVDSLFKARRILTPADPARLAEESCLPRRVA